MKLYTLGVDFTVKKVLAVAALAGVKVEVLIVSSADLTAIHSDAKSMCLEDDSGAKVANNVPILKHVAAAGGRTDMLGGDHAAAVDEWLDFSWQKLGK